MEISLCMIVKNEEQTLGKCLASVAPYMDEIVIVDTGSSDATIQIAEGFGAKVFQIEWADDFAYARNHAFDQATKEYVMWLDADDILTEENQQKLAALKSELPPSVDIVSMSYSLTRDEHGNTTCSLRRNRIVKRSKGYRWVGRVHEYLAVYGQYHHADIEVLHTKTAKHTDRNLRIFETMKQEGAAFSTRDAFYHANELYYNEHFAQAIAQYKHFIGLEDGWVEDRITAVINMVTCLDKIGQKDQKPQVILQSFVWTKPHPELCCRLAECFLEKGAWDDAAYWYKTALLYEHNPSNPRIVTKDYFTFVPAIQLCVCYARLNQFALAQQYNELAATFRADSPYVIHNRQYLQDKA